VETAYDANDNNSSEEEQRQVQLNEDIEVFSRAYQTRPLPDKMLHNRGEDDEDRCEMDDPHNSRRPAVESAGPDASSETTTTPIGVRPDAEASPSGGKERKKSAMEVLRDFDPEHPPSGGDKEGMQLWLECFAQRDAVTKHRQLIEKARDRKAFDSMSVMQRHTVQWFHNLRDTIELRQREYLLNQQSNRKACKRYGPFLCSLHPEKMAVILSQEAISSSLFHGGKNGHDGVPLLRMAMNIGSAVETEVVSQRRMKERYQASFPSSATALPAGASAASDVADVDDDDEEPANNVDGIFEHDNKSDVGDSRHGSKDIDRWNFSASHLKLFLEDIEKIGMGKGRRAINYAIRRAKKLMNHDEKWTADDIAHLGAALLSILVENALVSENGKEEPAFRVEKKWSHRSKKSTSFVVLHDRLQKVFLEEDYLCWAPNTTRHLPMIVPPSNWVGPKEGGYRWLEVDLIRTHGSSVQKEVLDHADLSLACDGLNILGKTAWKINKEILSVAEYCWENNIQIGDVPSRTDFEVPPEPAKPSRLSPEVYSDKESPESIAAMAANRSYRESVYKRQRILQKNMVCCFFFI
jgi:DNA-directed RNA polymerase N-terminal